MKRASIAALAIVALATPFLANAQDDAAKTAAITAVKAKLATVVDSSGKVAPNPCVVTNAADYGQIQEAYCDGGLSYMVFPTATGPRALECADVDSTLDDDGTLLAACRLPENRNPMAVVDKVIADTKTDCKPVAYDYVAETDTGSSIYFEAVCDSGKGYLVQVWKDPKDVKTFSNKVWACDPTTNKARSIDCELTKMGVAGAKAAEAKRTGLIDAYFQPKAATAPAAAARP